MKQRFTSLDLVAINTEFCKEVLNLRLQNIYDITKRHLQLKFAAQDKKVLVLLEVGFRIHITTFNRTTQSIPSQFVTILRKYLRTRRLTRIQQPTIRDRVLLLHFGEDYRLVLEFYSAGNVILTDGSFKILAAQRLVEESRGRVAIGEIYRISEEEPFLGMSEQRLRGIIEAYPNEVPKRGIAKGANEYPAALLSWVCQNQGLPQTESLAKCNFDILLSAVNQADDTFRAAQTFPVTGYVSGTPFSDFQPFAISDKSFPTYNETIDTYFSTLESDKLSSKLDNQHSSAQRRLESAKREHEQRLQKLDEVQYSNVQKAQTIEENLELVGQAIDSVNILIAQGMDWQDIKSLVKEEGERGNEVASSIRTLHLDSNEIQLCLPFENDDGENVPVLLDVDLALNPWLNATAFYDQKKAAREKQDRTMQSSAKALKSSERKITQDLKRHLKEEREVLRPVRNPFWFEKFYWFLSSDGYMILGARDAQQSEILVKRFFRHGDIYLHADVQGASVVIIKNRNTSSSVSPTTLAQAGQFSISTSRAWDAKIVTSAYWVEYGQVSKSAHTGEYLPIGSFTVRGKKNFLPPTQMVLGFGVLWEVDEESRLRRIERREKLQSTTGGRKETNSIHSINDADNAVKDESDNVHSDEVPTQGHDDISRDKSSSPSDSDEDFPDTQIDLSAATVEMDTKQSKDKYNLATLGSSESESDSPSLNVTSSAIRSAYTHETQKTSNRGGRTPETLEQIEKSASENKEVESKNPGHVRGKKGKLKKLAEKYADQDDEDRELAMKLLGSTLGIQKKQEEAEQKRQQEIIRREKLAVKKEREEARQLRQFENIEVLDEEDMATQLDSFVPDPNSEDVLVSAIPFCGPWNATYRFKYRVKLLPGNTKKGRAVKEAMAYFQSPSSHKTEPLLPSELELLKGLKDTELVLPVCVSKIKTVYSGGESTKNPAAKSKHKK